ncbi:ribonuclease H-like domain-containing protein [Mycena latifolia]|nr:ribonuclease H-like domain-containing protein [Mycena latifolia]
MAPQNPIWALFHQDKNLYKNDRHHHGAWCKECVKSCEERMRQDEIAAVARGAEVPPVKTQEEWEDAVKASNPRLMICGKVETMKTHAKNCTVINTSPERIVARDRIVGLADAATATAKRARTASGSQPSSSNYELPSPEYRFPSMPPQSPRFENSAFPSPAGQHTPLSPLTGFASLEAFSPDVAYSPSSAFAPSPSPSISESYASKRRRTSYTQSAQAPVWTADQQAEFGEDLCKLFVTCGWSWNAVNNPEFQLFFGKYLPSAILPDRRVLSGSTLKREADKVIGKTRLKIEEKLATYSEDGWKNVAHTHIDTSMLNVDSQAYLLRTHNMTGRPKTGDELFEIMKSDFEYAWNTYRVEIIASSLMTGNYLAIKAVWMQDAKQALEVVKWFNNHGKQMTIALTILHLLLPVVTRWTVHYCCLRRIKKTRACNPNTLRICAGRKPDQIEAAEAIIETCKRDSFWKNITRIARHLEPLAIAANVLQSPLCRLDTVLLTLGNLFRIFRNLPIEDAIVRKTLHESLERRWGKTDQQLMILGVFLNPYVRAQCFNRDSLSANAIFHLVRRAFDRLLGQSSDGDIAFLAAFREYYDGTGDFSAEAMLLELHSESYRKAKKPIDVIWLWKQMEGTICTGRSGFVKLAIRILSMLPNSAGPERAFSVFGITHTKHRNRLDPQKVHDATIVRMDRQKAHIAAGLVPERKSRRFSLADDEAEEEAATNAADAADYDVMAAVLINLAQEESNGDDDEEGPPAPAPPPSFPPPTAAQSVPDGAARVPAYKKIKLADLFNYPAADSPAGLFEFFWQVGRDGLDAEEDALAAATNGDASDLTAEPAATQPGTVTPMQA